MVIVLIGNVGKSIIDFEIYWMFANFYGIWNFILFVEIEDKNNFVDLTRKKCYYYEKNISSNNKGFVLLYWLYFLPNMKYCVSKRFWIENKK